MFGICSILLNVTTRSQAEPKHQSLIAMCLFVDTSQKDHYGIASGIHNHYCQCGAGGRVFWD